MALPGDWEIYDYPLGSRWPRCQRCDRRVQSICRRGAEEVCEKCLQLGSTRPKRMGPMERLHQEIHGARKYR